MPVDFRYHLASLLAVFCALLIGILLGIALIGDPSLENQVQAFRAQLARNSEQIHRLEQSERMAKQVLPYLIDGRLQGTRIAVILNRDLANKPWVEALLTTIQQAGGEVTSVTSALPSFRRFERKRAAPVFAEFGFPMPIEGDVVGLLAGKLAVRIADGSSELPYRLRRLGLIRVQGDYQRACDCVLFVGGADNDLTSADVIDLPIIRALQEAGKRVVACEATTDRKSCVHMYQRRAIPTVDDAETVSGQLAIVLVLAGASGDFGVRSTADQLLPPISSAGE